MLLSKFAKKIYLGKGRYAVFNNILFQPVEFSKEEIDLLYHKRFDSFSKKNINKSQKEIANEYMDKLNIDSDARTKIHKGLRDILEDENDVTIIQSVIDSLVQYVR